MSLLKEENSDVLKSLTWLKRRAAKRFLTSLVDERLEAERRLAVVRASAHHAELERLWQLLLANDPVTVLELVDSAFADNAHDSTVLDVEEDRLLAIMNVPGPEVFGEREATLTPSGNLSLKQLGKTRRNEMYEQFLWSHAVATAREAFAVAPGLRHVMIICVHLPTATARMAVVLDRDDVGATNGPPPSEIKFAVYRYPTMGRTKEPAGIDAEDLPGVVELVDSFVRAAT